MSLLKGRDLLGTFFFVLCVRNGDSVLPPCSYIDVHENSLPSACLCVPGTIRLFLKNLGPIVGKFFRSAAKLCCVGLIFSDADSMKYDFDGFGWMIDLMKTNNKLCDGDDLIGWLGWRKNKIEKKKPATYSYTC